MRLQAAKWFAEGVTPPEVARQRQLSSLPNDAPLPYYRPGQRGREGHWSPGDDPARIVLPGGAQKFRNSTLAPCVQRWVLRPEDLRLHRSRALPVAP